MSVSRLATLLALIGGILMIVFGGLGLIGSTIRGIFSGWTFSGGGLVSLIMGIIALLGANKASNLVWAVVLIVVGAVGGGIGGLLVLIGGILGLVVALGHRS